MNINVIFLISLTLLIGTVQTYAAGTSGLVDRIYPYGGHVNFRLKDDDCKSSAVNSYWQFDLDSETSKAWFAMLLSASATKTTIKLGVPECDPSKNQYISYMYQDF